MKRPILLLAVLAAALLAPKASAETNAIDAKATITDVVVYEDRAQVTRRAEVSLDAGENEVRFTQLPASLIEDSVRASGKGVAAVKITGLEIERVYLKDAAEEKVRELKKKLQALQDADADMAYRLEGLAQQREFIASIKMGTADKISKELLAAKPQPAQWGEVSEFIRKGMDENAAERIKVDVARRENQKEIDATKRELQQLAGGAKEEKTVTVHLEAQKGGPFTIDLSSVCGGAGWLPVYDARAEKEKGEVELTYKGAVVQATGEDWENVSLSLSTARPSVGGEPGELYPWYISLHAHQMEKRAMARGFAPAAAPPQRLMEQMASEEAVGGPDLLDAQVVTAAAERRGQAVLFKTAKPETVPSDGNPHLTTIAVEDLKAAFSYTAVPKLNEMAFLKARITNTTSYPFLSGKINIFLGPDFIGSSAMENAATDEEFDLYLGPDEGIKIERTLAEKEADKTFGIRKRGRTNFRYTIKVENLLAGKAKLTVKDQTPVSQSPEITVTLTAATPKPIEKPEEEMPGLLEWSLELAPKEKQTIEFSFSVEYPVDQSPIGL